MALFILYLIAVYFVGGINPAYIIGKIKGLDIREHGSGNAGASNALIVLGKRFGVLTGAFDIFKGWISVFLAMLLFPQYEYAGEIAMCAVVIGHIFPLVMKGRGGKGLSCFGGSLLALNWKLFLILLAVEIIIAFVSGYIAMVSITGTLIMALVELFFFKRPVAALLFFVLFVIMTAKHIPNIKRILEGTEMRMSTIWNKKKEMERVHKKEEEIRKAAENKDLKD